MFGVTDKEIEDIFEGEEFADSEPKDETVETNEAIARREHRLPYSTRGSDGRLWKHGELVNDAEGTHALAGGNDLPL